MIHRDAQESDIVRSAAIDIRYRSTASEVGLVPVCREVRKGATKQHHRREDASVEPMTLVTAMNGLEVIAERATAAKSEENALMGTMKKRQSVEKTGEQASE